MKTYVGIDPGFLGFLCIIEIDNSVNVSFLPMPIIKTEKKGNKKKNIKIKKDINGVELTKLLKNLDNPIIYLEDVHSLPHQGVVSTFSFGEGFGVVKGVLQALGYEFTLVSPIRWKNALIPQELRTLGKDSSIEAAKLIVENEGWDVQFPKTPRTKEILDGASDSFVIAYYGYKQNT